MTGGGAERYPDIGQRFKTGVDDKTDLYSLMRITPFSPTRIQAPSGGSTSATTIDGAGGNFLRTEGDTMIGPIAFAQGALVSIDGAGENIDISKNSGDYSTYVLVTGTGSPDSLKWIDGAAFNGQFLILQGTASQVINIIHATTPGTNGNIVTGDGSDVTLDGTIATNGVPVAMFVFDVTVGGLGAWRYIGGTGSGGGIGGSQTPWMSNIDADGYNLDFNLNATRTDPKITGVTAIEMFHHSGGGVDVQNANISTDFTSTYVDLLNGDDFELRNAGTWFFRWDAGVNKILLQSPALAIDYGGRNIEEVFSVDFNRDFVGITPTGGLQYGVGGVGFTTDKHVFLQQGTSKFEIQDTKILAGVGFDMDGYDIDFNLNATRTDPKITGVTAIELFHHSGGGVDVQNATISTDFTSTYINVINGDDLEFRDSGTWFFRWDTGVNKILLQSPALAIDFAGRNAEDVATLDFNRDFIAINTNSGVGVEGLYYGVGGVGQTTDAHYFTQQGSNILKIGGTRIDFYENLFAQGGDETINNLSAIQFSGTSGLTLTTENGIQHSTTNGRMEYNVIQGTPDDYHAFLVGDELVASITRVATNSGQISADFVQATEAFDVQKVIDFATYVNSTPANSEMWFEGGEFKFREGGVTKTLGSGGGGANQQLSNLTATVAINRNLLFNTTSADTMANADFGIGMGSSTRLEIQAGSGGELHLIQNGATKVTIDSANMKLGTSTLLDCNGNNIQNAGQVVEQQRAAGIMEYQFVTGAAVADNTSIGTIRWNAHDAGGANWDYAGIRGVMETDETAGNEEGSLYLYAARDGNSGIAAASAFMILNNGGDGNVSVYRPLQLIPTSGMTPAAGDSYIEENTGAMNFNVPTGDGYTWRVQGTIEWQILSSGTLQNGSTNLFQMNGGDIDMTGGDITEVQAITVTDRVHSDSDVSECGFFVKNETAAIGSLGTMQAPYLSQASTPTDGTLDGFFGAFDGAFGFWRDTDNDANSRGFVRMNGVWYYWFLANL